MEIVIDGLSAPAIAAAMRAGVFAIAKGGAGEGITHITAGNYGGNLGPHHFHLKDLITRFDATWGNKAQGKKGR
jgi:formylmethanofuran--tetrahydromethanopterin N-formyltransferase